MDRLSKVMYINLDHRTDRKKEIEDELKNVFKYNNAERLNATLHEHPILGCTYSHVRIWRRMIEEGWDSVLVIEDKSDLKKFIDFGNFSGKKVVAIAVDEDSAN